jgi:hypothetical protein
MAVDPSDIERAAELLTAEPPALPAKVNAAQAERAQAKKLLKKFMLAKLREAQKQDEDVIEVTYTVAGKTLRYTQQQKTPACKADDLAKYFDGQAVQRYRDTVMRFSYQFAIE